MSGAGGYQPERKNSLKSKFGSRRGPKFRFHGRDPAQSFSPTSETFKVQDHAAFGLGGKFNLALIVSCNFSTAHEILVVRTPQGEG